MRQSNPERAVRLMMASLLQSDLSPKQLRQVLDWLRDERGHSGFLHALGNLVRLVEDSAGGDSRAAAATPLRDPWASAAWSAIQRRRLSKKELIEAAERVEPGIANILNERSQPVKAILEQIGELASDKSRKELLALLSRRSEGEDEYLKGIMERPKRDG